MIFSDISELLPGLTKKPPLPKKLELANNNHKIHPDDTNKDKAMEAITDFLHLKYSASKKREPFASNSNQMCRTENFETEDGSRVGMKIEDTGYLKEQRGIYIDSNTKNNSIIINYDGDSNYLCKNDEQYCNKEISKSTTPIVQSMTFENDVMFQNWVEDVVQKESETDKYLEVLKEGHGMTNYNLTDNSKIVSSLSWTDEDKLPNISEIDLDRLFVEGGEHIHTLGNINKKANKLLKPVNSARYRKTQKQSPTSNKPKQRVSLKTKKVVREFDQTPCDKDVDSWMCESERKNISRDKTTYLDILSTLEDIENQTAPSVTDFKKDFAQHDVNEKISPSESIDDIVSILEVLENENKKSRKSLYICLVICMKIISKLF